MRAAEVTAKLDLDLSGFVQKLQKAEGMLNRLVGRPYTVNLGAGVGGATSAGNAVVRRARSVVSAADEEANALEKVQKASEKADEAISMMGSRGGTRADLGVKLKAVNDAYNQLRNSVVGVGGFAGLDPDMAAEVGGQLNQLARGSENLRSGLRQLRGSAEQSVTPLQKLQQASQNATRVIGGFGDAIARGPADMMVQMTAARRAVTELQSTVDKAGGFAGLSPEMGATIRSQITGLTSGMQELRAATASNVRPVNNLETALGRAHDLIQNFGQAKQGSKADIFVQMKSAKAALADLGRQVAASGGFAGMNPAVAAEVRAQMNGLIEGMKDLGSSTGAAETNFDKLMRTFQKASFVFIGIMALKGAMTALSSVIRITVSEAVRFEQVSIGFEKMLGSAQAATSMLQQLAEFATATPFELVDVENQAKRLRAYGYSAQEVIPILRDVGDAATATGTGADGINRITLALGQMRSAGKMNSRDMLQLTEAMVPAWDYVAKAMGKTQAEVRKLSEQGMVPAELAITAIRKGIQDTFGGTMQAQMKSLGGQWSNIKDRVILMARSIGMQLLPYLKEFVSQASAYLPMVQKFIEDSVAGTNDFGKALRTIGGLMLSFGRIARAAFIPVANGISFIVSVLAGDWEAAFSKAAKSPIAATAATLLLINTLIQLAVTARQAGNAMMVSLSASSIAQGFQLVAAGETVLATSTLGLGAAIGGLIGKFQMMIAALPMWATLAVAAASVIAGAALIIFSNVERAGESAASEKKYTAFYAMQEGWLALQKTVESGTITWKDAQAAITEYGRGVLTSEQAMQVLRNAYPGLAQQQEDLDAKLKALNEDFAKQNQEVVKLIPGLNLRQTLEKNLMQALVDVASAEDAVAKARKDSGSNTAQARNAELALTAARANAKKAEDEYRKEVIKTRLEHEFGATIAQWAANIAIKGANAVAKAQSGLKTTIANTSAAMKDMIAVMAGLLAAGDVSGAQKVEDAIGRAAQAIADARKRLRAIGDAPAVGDIPIPEAPNEAAANARKAAEAIKDAIKDALKAANDLVERFKQASRQMGNFAGLFGRPERNATRGSLIGNARRQLMKLTQYGKALEKLKKQLPASVFDEIVAAGPGSMDDVIRLARGGMAKQWAAIIQQRNAVADEITRKYTMPGDIAASRSSIISGAVSAAGGGTVGITINMNGSMSFSGTKDAVALAKKIAAHVDKELRAKGIIK